MGRLDITEITRDEGFFTVSEQGLPNRYLCCSLDGDPFLYVQLQLPGFAPDIAVAHLSHVRFGPQTLKAMRDGLPVVKQFAKDCGVRKIVGVTDGTVKNWARLMHMIGLDPWQLDNGWQRVIVEV